MIHGGIGQAEDERLIPHQGLIMAFGIADGFLMGAPVGQLVPEYARMPVFRPMRF